jgi:hypothetical protein
MGEGDPRCRHLCAIDKIIDKKEKLGHSRHPSPSLGLRKPKLPRPLGRFFPAMTTALRGHSSSWCVDRAIRPADPDDYLPFPGLSSVSAMQRARNFLRLAPVSF